MTMVFPSKTKAAYAFKIVRNSSRGVLGTPGCRFAASALAGAITGSVSYPLTAPLASPATMYLWAKMKMRTAGTMARVR